MCKGCRAGKMKERMLSQQEQKTGRCEMRLSSGWGQTTRGLWTKGRTSVFIIRTVKVLCRRMILYDLNRSAL